MADAPTTESGRRLLDDSLGDVRHGDRSGALRVGDERPDRSRIFGLEDQLRDLVRCDLEAAHGPEPHIAGREQHRQAAEAAHIALRHLAGETDPELAEALGVSARTARRRRELVRDALREGR
jgi:Homeodomain-like domain